MELDYTSSSSGNLTNSYVARKMDSFVSAAESSSSASRGDKTFSYDPEI